MTFLEKMKQVLLLNECSGDQSLAYRFSDADGVRTGRSGYSFGVCQFDVMHNTDALKLLIDCSFTLRDFARLHDQDTDIADLDAKLFKHQRLIDEADVEHMKDSYSWCKYNLIQIDAVCQPSEVMAMLIDYHNQLRFDENGQLHNYIKEVVDAGGDITPKIIRWFKRHHTAWGKKRPDDVWRRYKNVIDVFKGE